MDEICGLEACRSGGACQARTPCPDDERYICADCGDNVWSVSLTGERACVICAPGRGA